MSRHTLITFGFAGLLAGCFGYPNNGGQKEPAQRDDEVLSVGNIQLVWEDAQKSSNNNSISSDSLLPVSTIGSQYCFQNNLNDNNCRAAHPQIASVVGRSPVVVHAFQLHIETADLLSDLNIQDMVIDEATVTTAQLLFNHETGEASFGDHHTRVLYGDGSCNVSEAATVGFNPPAPGFEKVITGLYLYTSGQPLNDKPNTFQQAYFGGAVNLKHSGLKPLPSQDGLKFLFGYEPLQDGLFSVFGSNGIGLKDVTSFSGVTTFDDSGDWNDNGSGVGVTKVFGLTEAYVSQVNNDADPDNDIEGGVEAWKEHAIIGFCIRGRKWVQRNPSQALPLFLGSEIVTHRPRLRLKE